MKNAIYSHFNYVDFILKNKKYYHYTGIYDICYYQSYFVGLQNYEEPKIKFIRRQYEDLELIYISPIIYFNFTMEQSILALSIIDAYVSKYDNRKIDYEVYLNKVKITDFNFIYIEKYLPYIKKKNYMQVIYKINNYEHFLNINVDCIEQFKLSDLKN